MDEPVQALHLVLAQLAARDHAGLHLQAVARLLRAALLVAQKLLVLLLLGAACAEQAAKRKGRVSPCAWCAGAVGWAVLVGGWGGRLRWAVPRGAAAGVRMQCNRAE